MAVCAKGRAGGLVVSVALVAALAGGCQNRNAQEAEIVAKVRDNDGAAVTAFLAQGGDANATDRLGNPLIYIASGPKGGTQVLGILLAAGANPNAEAANGRSALQNAAGWCDLAAVDLLVNAGAEIDRVGGNGKRARDAVCVAPADRRAAVLSRLGVAE